MSEKKERGQVYLDNDSGETVTIAGTNTPVALAAGNVAVTSLNRYVEQAASAGTLKLAKGKHLIIATASVSVTSGKVIEMAVLKNATEESQALASLTSDGGRESMAAVGIVESDGDDVFSLAFANQTDTTNVTVYQASLVALAIDTVPPRPGAP